MRANFEKFVSPSGQVIESEVKGTGGHPSRLVWSRRFKLAGLIVLFLVVVSAPIWQSFIPRRRSFAADAVSSPTSTSLPSPVPVVSSPTSLSPVSIPTVTHAVAFELLIVGSVCQVVDFPAADGRSVGSFVSGSLIVPLGWWQDSGAVVWYFVQGGWLHPGCAGSLRSGSLRELEFVSPPMRPAITPTRTPLLSLLAVVPTVTPLATFTPFPVFIQTMPTSTPFADRFNFQPLPAGFDPGWCVAIRSPSVWLSDGSRYYATEDGYTYLSAGVLGQQLVIEYAGWYQDFIPDRCGKYIYLGGG